MARAVRPIAGGRQPHGNGLDRAADGAIDGQNGIGARIKSAQRRGGNLARLPGLWETATLEGVSGASADHNCR